MLEARVIIPSRSAWAAPALLVAKPHGGGWRFVTDFRKLRRRRTTRCPGWTTPWMRWPARRLTNSCGLEFVTFDPLGLGVGSNRWSQPAVAVAHGEAPPLEHAAWLDWFEPGNGGRAAVGRAAPTRQMTLRRTRRKIKWFAARGPRGNRVLVASAPGGRGVRLDGVERFGARLPQRARPQAKFEGSGPGLRSGRGGCVFITQWLKVPSIWSL